MKLLKSIKKYWIFGIIYWLIISILATINYLTIDYRVFDVFTGGLLLYVWFILVFTYPKELGFEID
jgi:hypothetical protein